MKTDTEVFGSRDERSWSPEPSQPPSCSAVFHRFALAAEASDAEAARLQ